MPMNEMTLKISEIANACGISVKAMRVYERLGIIRPSKVDKQTGYRIYSTEQVKQLSSLVELQRLGFSLVEIKSLLSDRISNDDYMEALVHKKIAWLDDISYAENKIAEIKEKIELIILSKDEGDSHDGSIGGDSFLPDWMVRLYGNSLQSEMLWL